MDMMLTIHDTNPKLWFALRLSFPVQKSNNGPTQWVKVPLEDGKSLTFYAPRQAVK